MGRMRERERKKGKEDGRGKARARLGKYFPSATQWKLYPLNFAEDNVWKLKSSTIRWWI